MKSETERKFEILDLFPEYQPSVPAWNLHTSPCRFRYAIWGVKGGKCLESSQEVLMADGSRRPVGRLRAGDRMMGYGDGVGCPTKIVRLERARKDCLEIEFVDRSKVRCSADHKFPVWNYKLRRVQVKPLNEIIRDDPDSPQKKKYAFLRPKEVHFESKASLLVDPYLLGLLLGDGGLSNGREVRFTNETPELVEAVKKATSDYSLTVQPVASNRYDFRLTSGDRRNSRGYRFNPLVKDMRTLGLMGCTSHTKFIPKPYLLSSIEARLQLLAGLVDTDGYVYNQNRIIEYCTMSEFLAEDVRFLVNSLGGYCSTRRGHVGQYRLRITLGRRIPTRHPKKEYTGELKRDKSHMRIRSWKNIGVQDCVHIEVECESHQFVMGNFMATQNSMMGAWEFCRWVLENPGIWGMVVGPTHKHTDVAWSEVLNILNYWEGLIVRCNSNSREITLVNGSKIDFRTGDRPDNLRGPNVDFMWLDEGGFLKRASWVVLRSRVIATHGCILVTTTLDTRNWLWSELIKGGMPADAPFGEWTTGERFVTHYPTSHFPWVDPSEIEAMRLDLSKSEFEREIMCMIIGGDSEVFRHVEEALSWEDPPLKIEGQTVMGVDLAKFQDFTAVVVMQHDGRVIHVDHWSETDWSIQVPRLIEIAKRWNSVIILDRSHVGSAIEESLRSEGVYVHPIDLNDAQKKREIIEGLQISFERRGIKIPDYRAPWTTLAHQKLHDELKNYQHSLTRTGRVSYSAPEGLHDDLVIALALANWGRAKGQAGGIGQVTEAYGSRKNKRPSIRNPARQVRSKMFKKVYGNRRSITGLPAGGSFWER